MIAITRTMLAVLASLLLAAQAAYGDGFDNERFADIVTTGQSMWQVPGIAVAVIEDGETVFQRGFGNVTPGGDPVDEHTLFSNASTTKAMVAAGVLLLVDDGKLDLDDPVIDYLPEAHFHPEAQTRNVTIRDLLTHRTGLPSTDFWTFRQLMPLEEQLRKLRLVAPSAAPRSRHIYQNTMYELAGIVIGRVAGKPWYEFLAERLWRPIGMHATVGMRGQIPAGQSHVLPHDIVDGELRAVPFDLPADREDAAGSAWSSLHDMTLWAQFLLRGGVTADGERLLSEESMAAMFEPANLISADDYYTSGELTKPQWRSYALGWYQQDFEGRRIDFHTGSLDGLVAIIGLDRAAGRAAIVLQNMDGSELRHALMWEVMDQRPAGQRPDWNTAIYDLYAERAREREARWQEIVAARLTDSDTSLPLAAYLGTWRSEVLGDIHFEQKGNDLILRTGMYEYEMSHWHLDTFLVDYLTWSYPSFAAFHVDPRARVKTLEVFGERFSKVEAGDEAASSP